MAKRTPEQKKHDKVAFIVLSVMMCSLVLVAYLCMLMIGMFHNKTVHSNNHTRTERVIIHHHPTRRQRYLHIMRHDRMMMHWTKAQYYAPKVIHNNHYISKVTNFIPLSHSHYVLIRFKPRYERDLRQHKHSKVTHKINRSINFDDKELQRISHDNGAIYVDSSCL